MKKAPRRDAWRLGTRRCPPRAADDLVSVYRGNAIGRGKAKTPPATNKNTRAGRVRDVV
jgi:hypothetical protein